MGKEEKGSVNEIVSSIAAELAKNELNFKESHKEDQDMLKILSMKIEENKDTVAKSIEAIYKSIKDNNIGVELPRDLKIKVANQVSQHVFENSLKNPEQIDIGDGMANTILEKVMIETGELEEMKNVKTSNIGIDDASMENSILNIFQTESIQVSESDINEYHNFIDEKTGCKPHSIKDYKTVDEQEKNVGKIFNPTLQDILDKANAGDQEAQFKYLLYQNASLPYLYTDSFENMPSARKTEYLSAMIMIADSDDPVLQELLAEMAEKAQKGGYNFWDLDKDGKKIVSIEKLQREYQREQNGDRYNTENAKKILKELVGPNLEIAKTIEEFHEDNTIQAKERMLADNLNNIEMLLRDGVYDPNSKRMLQTACAEFRLLCREHLDSSLRLVAEISQFSEKYISFNFLTENVLEALKDAREGNIEFKEDKYTENLKHSLFENLLKNMQRNGIIDVKLINRMKEADFELSESFAKNYGVKNLEQIRVLPKSETQKSNQIEEEKPEQNIQISNEQKFANLKKAIKNINDIKGMKYLQNFITDSIEKRDLDEKKMFIRATIDFLSEQDKDSKFHLQENVEARKKIFSSIINSRVATEETYKSMGEIDFNTTKEILQEMLKEYNENSGETKDVNDIMVLSEIINRENAKETSKSSIFKTDTLMTDGVSFFNNKSDKKQFDEDQTPSL